MNRRQTLIAGAALAAAARAEAPASPAPFPMRRGVNLGNALDAPNEGDWGYRIAFEHLDDIAAAGFDGVRVPVRWDTHMDERAPFRIDAPFMARVDEVVRGALARGLIVQLDVHHYEAMNARPDSETPRFRALWRQIAEHFADAPPALLFEPFNEPNGEHWTGERVRAMEGAALEEIRPANPERLVVVGGPNWNSIGALAHWTPPDDPHLAVTAHYYDPFAFTHEGATWVGPNPPHFGRAWGTDADFERLAEDIGRAAAWGSDHSYAMQIGEFGVNERLPLAQRALWTYAVRTTCESLGLAWCVWGLRAGFPVYDTEERAFIPAMLRALIDRQ